MRDYQNEIYHCALEAIDIFSESVFFGAQAVFAFPARKKRIVGCPTVWLVLIKVFYSCPSSIVVPGVRFKNLSRE